jgi:hypothetical protein
VGVGRLMANHAVLGVLGSRRIPTLRPGGLLMKQSLLSALVVRRVQAQVCADLDDPPP